MVRSQRMSDVLALALVTLFLSPVWAVPSHEDPEAPLAVRAEEESRQLQAEAYSLYQTARDAVASFRSKMDDDRLAEVKPTTIGRAHVAILQLDRLADHLITLGEPAGEDFRLRTKDLKQQLGRVTEAYGSLPGVLEQMTRGYEALRREAQKKTAILTQVKQLIDQQAWETAEQVLYEAIDELEITCIWYGGERRAMILRGFGDSLGLIESRTRALRRDRAQANLTKARRQHAPDFDALLREIRDAAAAVGTSGKAGFGDELLSGPELLARFGKRWQQAQHQAVRCLGLDWARDPDVAAADLALLLNRQSQFSREIAPAMAGLIEADAARATPGEARPLLVAYLEQLAPLVALSSDDSLARAAAGPLDRLVAGSPELSAEVEAYRAATADLLRWRRRTAAAYARARQAEFPALRELFLSAAQTVDSGPGLVRAGAAGTTAAEFTVPVPSLMRPVTARLLGRQVALDDLVGLPIETRITVARYRQRSYARFTVPDELAERFTGEVAALESDLLAGSTPPLTLDAAVALARARRGDLAAAGGEIIGIYLEPLVTRFATLSEAGRTLIPLGRLANEPGTAVALRQVIVQFEIKPAWVQHECFFLEANE